MEKKDLRYWEELFQSLQMKYYSFLAAPLFIFAVFFLRAENGNEKLFRLTATIEEAIVISLAIIGALSIMIAFVYTRTKFKQARDIATIDEKVMEFKRIVMNKYLLLFCIQLLIVLGYGMTYHNGLMGVFTGLLLYSSFFRPELLTVRRTLKLKKEEYQKIDYKSNIVS